MHVVSPLKQDCSGQKPRHSSVAVAKRMDGDEKEVRYQRLDHGMQVAQTIAVDEARVFVHQPREPIYRGAHMQATNKMGSSPSDSVVGRDFRVWGTSGLYVVDGSVFPTSVGANPMQSIYTFAKIFADGMTTAP